MSTEQSRRPVVFIVDPDATVRELVADVLGDLGLEAVEFDRVPDAFRQLIRGEKDPDLLIVDHYLPGPFSGAELAWMAVQRYPTLPVVLMTAFGFERTELEQNFVQLRILCKPWRLNHFISAIQEMVPDCDPYGTGVELHS